MPIDPQGTPAVNPRVNTNFASNLAGSPYTSTTEDLLDRIRKAIEEWPGSVSVGNLYTHTREGSGWVLGFDGAQILSGTIENVMAWMEITRDPANGNIVSVDFFEEPGGATISTLVAVRPVNMPFLTHLTFRVNGNISATANAWRDPITIPSIGISDPGLAGSEGNIIDLPFIQARYLDIVILPTSSGDESILPAGQVGFWADKAKTRFYPVNYADAVGPVSIRRGSPTHEGFLLQDIYVEATPGCQLEVTIVT